jgi:RNA polymerase sigma factor (sigma-70 family)
MTSEHPSDETLLTAFSRDGSQAAFRTLADRYAGLVYAAAFRRTGQRSLAEEVSQNVFAVLARKAASLARPEVKLAAWLHRAAVLEAVRSLRKESIRKRIMDDYFHQADVLSGQDEAQWQAVLPELDSALDSLASNDRELLIARFFEDRSYRELSAATGRSEAALMQHQHRALEKLSVLLQRRGAAVPVAVLAAGLASPSTHAAPAGLSAALAATAPTAAGTLNLIPLTLHTIDILMHTKSRLSLAAGLAACLLAGSSAFWVGKSRAITRGEAALAAVQPAPSSGRAEPGASLTVRPMAALDIRSKLNQAVAGWRANSDYRLRVAALEVLDSLAPEEVPVALEVLAGLKSDYGLHLALGKRIAILWGEKEPTPALEWLVGELPREHRGDPIQAILTGWSEREPEASLAWWQGVMDSLQFPVPENQFEGFEQVIYSGWAVHDAGSLAAQLPAINGPDDLENHQGTPVEKQLNGLATAAVNTSTRETALAAISAIPNEGTRAAAAAVTAMMMNVSDAAAGRDFLVSLPLSDPEMRNDLLGGAAMMGVIMQQQTPEEAVAWLRSHTDEATVRKSVESFLKEQEGEDIGDLATSLRKALETR